MARSVGGNMAQVVTIDGDGYPRGAVQTDIEASVLGSFMLHSGIYEEMHDHVDGSLFFSAPHRVIYRHIRKLWSDGGQIDMISVDASIASADEAEQVGGFAYLAEITKNSLPSAVHGHVKSLKECRNQRRLIDYSKNMLQQARSSADAGIAAYSDIRSSIDKLIEESTGHGMPLYTGSEGADSDVDWLIDGYVPSDSFGVVYGPGGGGKTFHAVDWACCVASGMPWDGKYADAGAVLYVATEGQAAFGGRVKAWEIVNDIELEHFYRPKITFTLGDIAQRGRLINTCEQIRKDSGVPVKLIVLDTLNRVFDGDENSTQDMTAFVHACDEIKARTGATVLVVHHSGKDETKGARGSSVLRNALDFEYSVRGVVADSGKAYQLKCTKMKDAEEPHAQEFRMVTVELGIYDKKGKQKTSLARKFGGVSARDFDGMNQPEQMLFDLINELVALDGNVSSKFLRTEYISRALAKTKTTEAAAAKQYQRAMNSLCKSEIIRIDSEKNVHVI